MFGLGNTFDRGRPVESTAEAPANIWDAINICRDASNSESSRETEGARAPPTLMPATAGTPTAGTPETILATTLMSVT